MNIYTTDPRFDAPFLCDCTVLYCDVRGFTKITEGLQPLDAFHFVEKIYQALAGAVHESGGVINNLTGDGILAVFGLKADAEAIHATQALNCALRIRSQIELWNTNRQENSEHLPEVKVGIGINSGPIAVGKMSLDQEFRIIVTVGDVVNTAARVEDLTKDFAIDILLSESTKQKLNGRFPLLTMPEKTIRGKKGLHQTYWLEPTATHGEKIRKPDSGS